MVQREGDLPVRPARDSHDFIGVRGYVGFQYRVRATDLEEETLTISRSYLVHQLRLERRVQDRLMRAVAAQDDDVLGTHADRYRIARLDAGAGFRPDHEALSLHFDESLGDARDHSSE